MAADKTPFAKFLTHFTKGTVLFSEGDEGEDMYIIQSGKVAIKKRVPHGETTLAVLEKGDFFGEMAMLERMPRSATAEMVGGRRPDRDRRRHLRGHDQGQPRDRRPHAAQVLDPPAGDHEADRAAGGGRGRGRPRGRRPRTAPATDRHRAGRSALAYFVSVATGNVFPVFKQRVAHRPLRLGHRHEPRGRPHQRGPEPQHLAPPRPPA